MPHSAINDNNIALAPTTFATFGSILCQKQLNNSETVVAATQPAPTPTTISRTSSSWCNKLSPMTVEKQDSTIAYKFQRNDRIYLLHDVVKNDPFCVTLTTSGEQVTVDGTLTCALIYNDFDIPNAEGSEMRAVKTISGGSPFQWTVLEKSAQRVVVRFRIDGALSSQHKDAHQLDGHFRIAITFVANNGEETRAFSHPIRGSFFILFIIFAYSCKRHNAILYLSLFLLRFFTLDDVKTHNSHTHTYTLTHIHIHIFYYYIY